MGSKIHQAFYSFRTRCSFSEVKRPGLKLIIHQNLEPKLRMSGALPLLPMTPSRRELGQLLVTNSYQILEANMEKVERHV